jgi:hypothetical protein
MADDKTIEARFKKNPSITIDDVFAVAEAVVQEHELHEEIVGYTPEGKPINKEEFIKRIQLAEEQIKRGEVIDFEDFKKEMENW